MRLIIWVKTNRENKNCIRLNICTLIAPRIIDGKRRVIIDFNGLNNDENYIYCADAAFTNAGAVSLSVKNFSEPREVSILSGEAYVPTEELLSARGYFFQNNLFIPKMMYKK